MTWQRRKREGTWDLEEVIVSLVQCPYANSLYILYKCTHYSLKYFTQVDVIFEKKKKNEIDNKKILGANNGLNNVSKWGSKLALDSIFTS